MGNNPLNTTEKFTLIIALLMKTLKLDSKMFAKIKKCTYFHMFH